MRYLQYQLVLLGSLGFSAAFPIGFLVSPRDDKADVEPLLTAVNMVTTSVANLDNIVNTLSPGNTAALATLMVNSDAVQQSLVTATTRVQAVDGVLKTNDAADLRDQVEPLITTTQTTITDLMAKQDIIIAAGAAGQTMNVLQGQKSAAVNFSNALQVKVPKGKQKTAAEMASDVAGAFDQGIQLFSAAAAMPPATATPPSQSAALASSSTDSKKKNEKGQKAVKAD